MPDLTGRVAVITGANTGVGYDTAQVLATHGATVVLACRSEDKAAAAAERITKTVQASDSTASPAVTAVRLDLTSLASVTAAADALRARHPRIDLLINNTGVMDTPYSTTADGFELQLGTNHLGHFAFTGQLLPALLSVPGSRIVNVSSLAHRRGTIDFTDLPFTRNYKPATAYFRSKLANLLFTFELQRRLAAAGTPTIALAAHPGFAKSELIRYEPRLFKVAYQILEPFIAQSSAMGALPSLRAATDPAAVGGEYYGPDKHKEQKGHPVLVSAASTAHDSEVKQRLWSESEKLTGVTFSV